MPRKQKGGNGKINNLILQIFSKDKVDFLPLSSIFANNISHKYVHMVSLQELRNLIDNNKHLKKSSIIMNIYNREKVIPLNDIYNNSKNPHYIHQQNRKLWLLLQRCL